MNTPEDGAPVENPDDAPAAAGAAQTDESSAPEKHPPAPTPGESAWMEKINAWNEAADYRAVIDALEALPPEERTPLLTGELARAYNNLAQPGERAPFLRALDLLGECRGALENTHEWNYRCAFSLFYLDREGEALSFWERALELKPDDPDTIGMIRQTLHFLTVPQFVEPFRVRAAAFWEAFLLEESALAAGITSRRPEEGEAAAQRVAELLDPLDVRWSLGLMPGTRADPRMVLELSPEHDLIELLAVSALFAAAPAAVRERWALRCGRGRLPAAVFERLYAARGGFTDGLVNPSELRCSLEAGEGGLVLQVYSETLCGFEESESGPVFRTLTLLIDHLVGEAASARFISAVTLLRRPPAGEAFPILELAARLAAREPRAANWTYEDGRNERLEYWLKPKRGAEAPGTDIRFGETTAAAFLNGLRSGDPTVVNTLAQKGAAAGLVYFERRETPDPEAAEALHRKLLTDLRALLADMPNAATVTGEAFSDRRSYLEVVLWDARAVFARLNAYAGTLGDEAPVLAFRSFHPKAGILFFRSPGDAAAAAAPADPPTSASDAPPSAQTPPENG